MTEPHDAAESQPYGFDFLNTLSQKIGDLAGFEPMCRELAQNADDEGCAWIRFELGDSALIVTNPSTFSPEDWDNIRTIGSEAKRHDVKKTGRFGVGFVSVFQVSDHPKIQSGSSCIVIHPEDQKVYPIQTTPIKGTRFTLRWAMQRSPVRVGLKKPEVRPTDIPEYLDSWLKALPETMLFLGNIRKIEVVGPDGRQYQGICEHDVTNHTRTLKVLAIGPDDTQKTLHESWWMVFEHREEGEVEVSGVTRNGSVAVAFPLLRECSTDVYNGWLYATLPTRTHTDLPVSLNADFAVKSDRMTIVDTGNREEADWNNKLVLRLADLYVSSMLEAKGLVDHRQFANLFPLEKYSNPACPLLEEIPRLFISRARHEPIIPTKDDAGWHLPAEARLLSRQRSLELYDILSEVGAPLVVPELTGRWNFLTECLGVPLFELKDLGALLTKDTQVIYQEEELPKSLRNSRNRETLWQYVENEARKTKDPETLQLLPGLPICPCEDGKYRRFVDAHIAESTLIQAMPCLKRDYPLVESAFLAAHAELCRRLCSSLRWDKLVEVLGNRTSEEIQALVASGSLVLARLYELLCDHEEALKHNVADARKIAALPVFQSKGRDALSPLNELCLPGDFQDPIGLGIVVATESLTDRVIGTFKTMGLGQLTLREYALKVIPTYFSDPARFGQRDCRVDLLMLIRKKASELEDTPEVFELLRKQPCLLCADGKYRVPSEVYIGLDDLGDILKHYPTPAPIYGELDHDDGLRGFLARIGAKATPQVNDLIHEVRAICAKPFSEGVAQVERIFYHLARKITAFKDDDLAELRQLRTIEWLPVEGSDEYALPEELFLRSQAKLVGHQGNILRFIQEASITRSFREAIGLAEQPGADILISNLRDLRSRGGPVDYYIYRVLNDGVKDLTPKHKHALANEALLYLGAGVGFVLGRHVYRCEHPFGTYRFSLPEELKQYSPLMHGVMGVQENVQDAHYIEVLVDMSEREQYARGHSVVSDDDRLLLLAIYAHLSRKIEDEAKLDIDAPDEWRKLSAGHDVVLTRSGQLKIANICLIADKEWLARLFEGKVNDLLVDNDPNTRRFLEHIGVRPLSAVAKPREFKEPDNLTPSPLQDCLRSGARRKQFRRIAETFGRRYPGLTWQLDTMLDSEIYECDELEVEYCIKLNGTNLAADKKNVDSYFEAATQAMYINRHLLMQLQRLEVSRQLAGILCPQLDPSTLASPLAYLLDSSQTDDDIRRILNHLGMDEIEDSAPPVVSEGHKEDSDTIVDDADGGKKPKGESGNDLGGVSHPLGRSGGQGGRQTPTPIEKEPQPDEMARKRQEVFQKKAKSYASRTDFERVDAEKGFDEEKRPSTPEERAEHEKRTQIFYNREIRILQRRLERMAKGEEPYDIYSAEWEELSRAVRARDGHKCRRCEVTEEELKAAGYTLVVHHIVSRRKGGSNWPSNLISLCQFCHVEVENAPELL